MRETEMKYIEDKIYKMGIETSNIKHLTRILEEILVNASGNLNGADVATLINIIVRTATALSNQMEKFEVRLGM